MFVLLDVLKMLEPVVVDKHFFLLWSGDFVQAVHECILYLCFVVVSFQPYYVECSQQLEQPHHHLTLYFLAVFVK